VEGWEEHGVSVAGSLRSVVFVRVLLPCTCSYSEVRGEVGCEVGCEVGVLH
jgi:hypothetical protein